MVGGEVQVGGDICIRMADSCCCIAEAKTVFWINYTPIKKKSKAVIHEAL